MKCHTNRHLLCIGPAAAGAVTVTPFLEISTVQQLRKSVANVLQKYCKYHVFDFDESQLATQELDCLPQMAQRQQLKAAIQ